jgi:hypothetical protein
MDRRLVRCIKKIASIKRIEKMKLGMSNISWRKLKVLSTIIAASFLLSGIAFYNGYPLVYSDTSGYLGLKNNLLFRSFFYTLLIFPSSWFRSLWPVVFLQSLIVAHLLHLILRVVFSVTSLIAYMFMIALLCLLTNLPWFTGFIMPDIFTGIMILSLYLLLFCRDNLGLWERRYLFLLTVISATVHLTHIPLALGMIVIVWFFRVIIKNKNRFQVPHLLIASLAILLAFILIVANNYRTQGVFTLSPGGYAFLLARFVADGPAVKYLKDSCPEKKYKLCDYIEQLPCTSDELFWPEESPTINSDKFLWSIDSPFRKVGWINGYHEEGNEIVKQTINRYPFLIIKYSLRNIFLQLPMINNCYGICSYIKLPHLTEKIREYYPNDFHAYEYSRQSRDKLHLYAFNRLHHGVIYFSLVIVFAAIFIFIRFKKFQPIFLLIFIVSAYIISSFITGTINGPHNRYGSRIIWLFPFFSMASLMHIINHWKKYMWLKSHNHMIIILFTAGALFSIIFLKYFPVPFIWISVYWMISFGILTLLSKNTVQKSIWFNLAFIIFILGALEGYSYFSFKETTNNEMYQCGLNNTSNEILGYAPTKSQTAKAEKYIGQQLIYNVSYTINDLGLRSSSSVEQFHKNQCILFFGDSFTFGLGVNDFETMPYIVQKLSKHEVYNFGYNGYGPHQMLSAIQHGIVKDTTNSQPRIVIYQAALFQVSRSAGFAWWDKHGPRYILLPNGSIKYNGHFDDGNWVKKKIGVELVKSFICKKYFMNRMNINEKDVKLFIDIIGYSQKLLNERYPEMEFHVIYWDKNDDRFNNILISGLKGKGIHVHLISEILPDYSINESRYMISKYDQHPNSIAHQRIAQYVVNRIVHEKH